MFQKRGDREESNEVSTGAGKKSFLFCEDSGD